jgi:Zn-dependent protease
MPDIASGLVYYVVFLFSTTLHEAAHAWTAMRGGDRTAYHGGQVTLDPLPHIRREPFGMVVLPLLSVLLAGWPIGFASAPFDPAWALRHPRRAAWMALAGPVGNFILVLVAAILIRSGLAGGVFQAPDAVSFGHIVDAAQPDGPWHAVGFLVSALFSLNLLLCLFNLIPLPPLDGSGIVPLFLQPAKARAYQEFIFANRGLGMIGMLVAWKIFDPIFHPVWLFAVNLLHTGVSYG